MPYPKGTVALLYTFTPRRDMIQFRRCGVRQDNVQPRRKTRDNARLEARPTAGQARQPEGSSLEKGSCKTIWASERSFQMAHATKKGV